MNKVNKKIKLYKKFFKHIIDFALSLIGFIAILPIFIVVSIVLFFTNEGKPFFLQERPGQREKVFRVIKFRSMNDKRDEKGSLLSDHERLTPVGKFIRKTSLDELPQLINVLKGDMSLIGPRPLLMRYLPFYTEREKLRHTVRPGITGLAQISGRNNTNWNARLELDVQYVETLSFINDIKIFFLSIYKVLKREGVVADKTENYLDIERQNNRMS